MARHYVCVTGGRDYSDRDRAREVLTYLAVFYGQDLRLMHGAARGADRIAGEEAIKLGVTVKEFPADWDAEPRRAGHIRNARMCDYLEMCRSKGHTVQVVAFPGGNGTAGMVREAESRGIDVDQV